MSISEYKELNSIRDNSDYNDVSAIRSAFQPVIEKNDVDVVIDFVGYVLSYAPRKNHVSNVLEAVVSFLPEIPVESHSKIATELSKKSNNFKEIMPAKFVFSAFQSLLPRLEGGKTTVSIFETYKSFVDSSSVSSSSEVPVPERLSVMFSFFEHIPFSYYVDTLRSYLARANQIIGLTPDSKVDPSPSLIRLYYFWADFYCAQRNFARGAASLISAVETAHALGDPQEAELANNAAATAILSGASRNKADIIAKCLNNETIAHCSLAPLLHICAKNNYIWHKKDHADMLPKLSAALTPLEKKMKTNAGLDLATAGVLASNLKIISQSFHSISLKELSSLFSLSVPDTLSFIGEVITDRTCSFSASIDAVNGFVDFFPAKEEEDTIRGFEQHTAVTESVPYHSDSDSTLVDLRSNMDAAISATEDLYNILSSKH